MTLASGFQVRDEKYSTVTASAVSSPGMTYLILNEPLTMLRGPNSAPPQAIITSPRKTAPPTRSRPKSSSAALKSALPANGLAVEGKIGAGTLSPAAFISGYGTTEQARSSYDVTTYKGSLVSSTGLVTETLAGTAAGIKWLYSDATTNAIYSLATFAKNSTGAGAAGLGLSITLAAKTSTTVDMPQVTLASAWVVATHATRTARGTLNAVDYNGTREAIRWEADGTVARLGFFGATAVVKPTAMTTQLTTITYTDPGTPDYAVSDVTQTTPFGFTTADEARTVLSIIKNLQDRVGQLETKLQALGLLT